MCTFVLKKWSLLFAEKFNSAAECKSDFAVLHLKTFSARKNAGEGKQLCQDWH